MAAFFALCSVPFIYRQEVLPCPPWQKTRSPVTCFKKYRLKSLTHPLYSQRSSTGHCTDGTFTYIIYIKFVNIYGLRACGSVSIYVESQSRLNAFLRYITPPFPLPPFFALLLNQNAPASQVFLSVYACYPAAPFHTKRNIYGLK